MRTSRVAAAAARGRGFGLTELMVSMVVMALVLAAVFATFFRSQRSAQRVTASVEKRQMGRAAVQLIERDVRMAGSGWGRTPVSAAFNGNQLTLNAISPGYGGLTGTDSLTVVGAWEASTTLSNSMPSTSSVLKVGNTNGFADGDLCVITNGASVDMFQVTQVNSSSLILQHNPASPYNAPGGHNGWPAGGYGVGALVYKITWLVYKMDSTTYRKPALVRSEVTKTSQLVAYDVQSFQVRYRMQDGSVTRNPAGLALIDRVIPVITMRVPAMNNQPALTDSVWATVIPRTF